MELVKYFFQSLVSALLFIEGIRSTSNCEWTRFNATYDLHALTLQQGGQSKYYKVFDTRWNSSTSASSNFTYAFNICEQTLAFPSESDECETSTNGYCPTSQISENLTCSSMTTIVGEAFAYQINHNTQKCHHLSNSVDNDFEFSLFDDNDPSAGVVLRYPNGDFCSGKGKNREFNIRFECENDAYNVPDTEVVDEYETCEYNLTIPSIYGCPIECGVYSYSLCASQGVCGYDWSNRKAKCFCYHGYEGNDCATYNKDTASATPSKKEAPTDSEYVHTFIHNTTLTDSSGVSSIKYVNVTYDLSVFKLSNDVFRVDDEDSEQFEYYFNVLSNINPVSLLPVVCENATDSCDFQSNPNCTDLSVVNRVGAAFQYNNQTDICNLVGTVDDSSDYEWSLLDKENPAKGVVLTYVNGGYCAAYKKNREFAIELECPDSVKYFSLKEELNITEYVDETHDCSYTISVETALACPYQCITQIDDNDNYTVCSGKGVCAADPSAGFVRCLCDDGFSGSDCTTVVTSSKHEVDSHVTFEIVIAVILILLVALIACVIYLYCRNRTLEKYGEHLIGMDDDDMRHESYQPKPTVPDDDYSDDDDSEDDAGIGDGKDTQEMVTVKTDMGNHNDIEMRETANTDSEDEPLNG